MSKFYFFTVLLTFLFQAGFCEDQQPIPEDYTFNYILPINWASDDRYNLTVTIPQGFRALQSQSSWLKKETPLIEFIPKNETENNWTEIITINKYIGQGLSAETMIKNLKNTMLSNVENGKVKSENLTKEPSYIFGNLDITYDLNGNHEIFGSRYYSGPYDTVGVQYTIRAKKDKEEEALKKIEDFFNENTRVIQSKPEPKAA